MTDRLILTVAMTLLVPAVLMAQETGLTTAKVEASQLVAPVPVGDARLPAPGTAAQPAAPVRAERRRRGSMVGYIEDATVRTQVRMRFDAGFGNDVPDRAEFFYAKCGCYQFDPPP